jgi:GLPGLI family protein
MFTKRNALWLLALTACCQLIFCQIDKVGYIINYQCEYQMFSDQKEPFKEYFRLKVYDGESYFQSLAAEKIDSISSLRASSFSDINNLPNTNHKYSIYIKDNDLLFHSYIALNYMHYEEKLNFNWQITEETREINGYTARKAITSYGGRNWEAWYTSEIPLNSGPYKFKGLPGLILEVKDSDNLFHFTLHSMYNRKVVIKKYAFHVFGLENCSKLTRQEFNKILYHHKNHISKRKVTFANGLTVRPSSSNSQKVRDPNKEKVIYTPIEVD